MRKILFGAFFICLTQMALGQTTVNGTITDTLGKKNLANAVVILQKKDSTLYKFVRTDKKGTF